MRKEEKILNNVVNVLAVLVTMLTIFVAITCTLNFGTLITGYMYETIYFDSQEEKEFTMVISFLLSSGSIGLAAFTVSYTLDKLRKKEIFS